MTCEFFRPQKDPIQRIHLAIALDNPNTFEHVIKESNAHYPYLYNPDPNGTTLLIYAAQQDSWNIVHRIIEKYTDVIFEPIHQPLLERLSNLHLEVEDALKNIDSFEGNLQKHCKILKQKLEVQIAYSALMQQVFDSLEKTMEVEDSQDEDEDVDVERGASFTA